MKKAILRNMHESHKNLADKRVGFLLRELLPLFEQILKIALVAELSNDVAVVGSTEDIVAFQHVHMVQLLQSIYLTL